MSETELLNIEWRLPEWIMANGGLNNQNVLDYFSLSPFWDPTSNNAMIKMQTAHNTIEQSNMDLTKMTGIEFVVLQDNAPTLFVIQKQRRSSSTDATPISLYYILNGNIYQCPDLYSVLANRMMTSLYHLMSSFKESSQSVNFLPFRGYRWNNDPQFAGENKKIGLKSQQIRDYRACAERAFFKVTNPPAPEPTPRTNPKQLPADANGTNVTDDQTKGKPVPSNKKELPADEKPAPKSKRKKTGESTRGRKKKSQMEQQS